MLGFGKGAFGTETDRLGVPFAETKPRFEEARAVLEALLTQEEVSWSGTHYNFPPQTIMPGPEDPIPPMVALINPPGIEAAAAKGYRLQTTPLSAKHDLLESQVDAFHRGKAQAGPDAANTLSLQRGVYLVNSEAERRRIVAMRMSTTKVSTMSLAAPASSTRASSAPCPAPRRTKIWARTCWSAPNPK